MSNIVVVVDEGTSSRACDKDVPLQSFGRKNKGNQSMDMVNQSLMLERKGGNHLIGLVSMLFLIEIGII